MNQEINKDKIIEEYKIKQKKDKFEKIVLIIIIIMLIIVYLVSFRIGVIEDIGGLKNDYNEGKLDINENDKLNQGDKVTSNDGALESNDITLSNGNPINVGANTSINNEENNEEIDTIKLVQVNWNGKEVTKNTALDIFKNEKFGGQKIIAPNSKGSSTFCVENNSDIDMLCEINFTEETDQLINMKYRLKVDNKYIVGNENKYVDLQNLNLENIKLAKKSINMYTIEWYWEDSDEEDTYVSTQTENQYYTLNFEIYAEEYIK